MRLEAWPEGLTVVTACVGREPRKWRLLLDKHDFPDEPGWTNVLLDNDSAGVLTEILGKGGGTLLLLDADGRVLHSNILPATLLPVLRESFARKVSSP